jgi:hypothetical protein
MGIPVEAMKTAAEVLCAAPLLAVSWHLACATALTNWCDWLLEMA